MRLKYVATCLNYRYNNHTFNQFKGTFMKISKSSKAVRTAAAIGEKRCVCSICNGAPEFYHKPSSLKDAPYPAEHYPKVFMHDLSAADRRAITGVASAPQPQEEVVDSVKVVTPKPAIVRTEKVKATKSPGATSRVFEIAEEEYKASGVVNKAVIISKCIAAGIHKGTAGVALSKWIKSKAAS